MLRLHLLGSAILFTTAATAQVGVVDPAGSERMNTGTRDTTYRPGTVTYEAAPRLQSFLDTQREREQVLDGYRVQVFLGNKTEAVQIRTQFLQRHPDIPAYLSYLAPNFRIRIGDLRDRLAAEKLRHEIRAEFPGSYVVNDRIELPRLPEVSP